MNTKNQNTETLPTLEELFINCNINLKGITWSNISLLGDNNIKVIGEAIVSKFMDYNNLFKEFRNNPLMTPELQISFDGEFSPTQKAFTERGMLIYNELMKNCRGEQKPLLPNLREDETFHSEHLVVYTDPDNNEKFKRQWRSAVNCSPGSIDRQTVLFLHKPSKDELKANKKNFLHGYYYSTAKDSVYVMTYDDLLWLRNNEDKEFNTLYYENSNIFHSSKPQEIWEERVKESVNSRLLSTDFKSDVKKFKKEIESENFDAGEDYKRNFLRHIEDQYS